MHSIPRDLICFSHLRWGFVYQRPQHLMARFARHLAAAGGRVLFWEEPITTDGDAQLCVETCSRTGVTLVTPHLPRSLEENRTNDLLEQLLNDLLRREEIESFTAWYYTPMMWAFTHQLRPSLVVYDCMDELSLFKDAPPMLREHEDRLFRRADLVFTGGQSLYEAKRKRHPDVHAFPSSVDVKHFEQGRANPADPPDQAAIPHPRIGWCGVIDERMDLSLLAAVAAARPAWQFVLLGPVVKIDPGTLPTAPNIHYLGGKTYDELPLYIGNWAVSMMPFAHNDSTRFISPTKTPEYLAAGKPVVSTSVRDVVNPYVDKGLVRIGDTAEEFVAAIEAASEMNGSRPGWLMKVDDHLRGMSWDVTWSRMAELMAARLQETGSRSVGNPGVAALRGSDPGAAPGVPALDIPDIDTRRERRRKAYDYLVVGAGFAGSVVAEQLARNFNKRVLLIDRRSHIGGNAYDHYNEDGILVHRYGPHIFHTNSREVFEYLSRFTEWRPYEHRVLASVDGKLVPVPINLDTVNRLYDLNLTPAALEQFLAAVAEKRNPIRTSEDVVVSRVGRDLYERLFRNYTRKQWNLDPSELDASVTARLPVRMNRDDRYFSDIYQFMPLRGYTRMFEKMLDHPHIDILLNTDYQDVRKRVRHGDVVFTGPVDEYFDYRFGKLPYRSLEFKHETVDQEIFQEAPVVNYPSAAVPYTRITEFKYLTGQQHAKTSVVHEFPQAEGDPYYPVPRPENAILYKRYRQLAESTVGVHFVGRLATYKYYNMDQVVAQALATIGKMMGARRAELIGRPSQPRPALTA
jgi:UDP-galactopyranose mutase